VIIERSDASVHFASYFWKCKTWL